MGSVLTYDTTPGNNTQTGDGTSVAEGVNAALVNNAQRSQMADIANWRDIIGGAKTAGGSANVLTLTTGVSVSSYADGQMYSFVASADNTGAATLSVDAVGAKAIRKDGDTALVGGEIKTGGHYIVQYDASANSAAGAFLLINTSGYLKDREAEGTIASAATCDIGAEAEYRLNVTGTTTITSFGTTANSRKLLRFSDVVTLTYNATSLILPGAANITTTSGDIFEFASDGSGNWRCIGYVLATVGGANRGYIFGLTLSNNATDATNDIDIADGTAASDGDTPVLMTLSSGITKQLDASWAVGNGAGGLDTGSIADTTYHVWLIRRSDTGVVDALFSASATSPTMPANYDQKRRIGSILRESGAIVSFVQDDDVFMRGSAANVTNSNPGTSAYSVTLALPTGIRLEAILTAAIYYQGASLNSILGMATDLSRSDTVPGTGNANFSMPNSQSGGTTYGVSSLNIFTNTSGQVRLRISYSDANTSTRTQLHGWIDRRGRLS